MDPAAHIAAKANLTEDDLRRAHAVTPHLLPNGVMFDAMASEAAANGLVQHHLYSYNLLLQRQLPQVLLEAKEVVALTRHSCHTVSYPHVHVEVPVAKKEGGFYDYISADDAKLTQHTLANPVVIDAQYRLYSDMPLFKGAPWETVQPGETDRIIQILERKRKGLPFDDLGTTTMATTTNAGAVPVPVKIPGAARRRRKPRIVPVVVRPGAPAPPQAVDPAAPKFTLREARNYRQLVQFYMPSMVGGVCASSDGQASFARGAPYDYGGYFVVKGTERVMIPQKQLDANRYYVFENTGKTGPRFVGEIRPMHASKIRSTSTIRVNLYCGHRGSGPLGATVNIPYMKHAQPLAAICMLLGWRSAEEVATCVATGGLLTGVSRIAKGSALDTPSVHATRLWTLALLRDGAEKFPPFEALPRQAILAWIGDHIGTPTSARKRPEDRPVYAAHLMANEFLPELGLDSEPDTIARKAQFFAYMLWRLAQVARKLAADDGRDHAGNKSYHLPGTLLALLLRQHYRSFRKRMTADMRRYAELGRCVPFADLASIKRLTDGLVFALSTGKWGMQKGASTQTGVAHMVIRLNLVAMVSLMRRLNTPGKREGKTLKPRQLQQSNFGLECPAETPEGEPSGLVNQMTQMVLFCHGHSAELLIRIVARVLGPAILPLLDRSILTGSVALMPVRNSVLNHTGKPAAVVNHGAGEWEPTRHKQAASDDAVDGLGLTVDTAFRVVVNGILIGFVADGFKAAAALRAARRDRRLPFDVAVELLKWQGVLNITGEAGGRRRPLFVLERYARLRDGTRARLPIDVDAEEDARALLTVPETGEVVAPSDVLVSLSIVQELWERYKTAPRPTLWNELLLAGAVEYVSKHEEENLMVLQTAGAGFTLHAPLETYTRCEIHPSTQLGLAAALIPCSDYNQAPRTTYFTSMAKQVAGNPGPETPFSTLRLMYPQRPLVTTWAQVIHGAYRYPSSQNVWVAVCVADGLNQDDSLVGNKDSFARGLFAAGVTRNHMANCQRGTGADSSRFELPPSNAWGRVGNKSKLQADAIVAPNTVVEGGDVIIAQTQYTNEFFCPKRSLTARDQCHVINPKEKPSTVVSVRRCRARDERDNVVVQTNVMRFMKPGDKLSSPHAQKGILGGEFAARDLPYTATGIVPDIVINPHAFPSRMTIGMLVEGVKAMICALMGGVADGTPFLRPIPEDPSEVLVYLHELLKHHGLEALCDEVMYSGVSGRPLTALIFCCPNAYYRLRQMIDDKIQMRDRGPNHLVTRQPMEGKAHEGGLKNGEMEVEAFAGHGASDVIRDRLLYSSDYAEVPVCQKCGFLAQPVAPREAKDYVVGHNETAGYCDLCRNNGNVYMVPMPRVTALFIVEMAAMGVKICLKVDVNAAVDACNAMSVAVPHNCSDPEMLASRVVGSGLQQAHQPPHSRAANPWLAPVPELDGSDDSDDDNSDDDNGKGEPITSAGAWGLAPPALDGDGDGDGDGDEDGGDRGRDRDRNNMCDSDSDVDEPLPW